MVWKDGWPFLANGTNAPSDDFIVPYSAVKEAKQSKIPFNAYTVENVFQSVRTPMDGRYKILSEREIELVGGRSIRTRDNQSLFAVRQTDAYFRAEVTVKFRPEKFSHLAGLSYRYNEANQYLLYMSFDEEKGKNCIRMQRYMKDAIVIEKRVDYIDCDTVRFFVQGALDKATMGYIIDGKEIVFADDVDTSVLSDEAAYPMGFTGAFVGFYAGDLSAHEKKAVFADFIYDGKGDNV